MRRAGALAAAVLLALAFGSAGCDLVSSLTPFGIGHQDYNNSSSNVNGDWVGKTATDGDVTFQVGNNTVSKLVFLHVVGTCTLTFDASSLTAPVINDEFTVELALKQGRVVATGKFTSSATCSGTYFFEGLATGACPTAGSGSFAADKTTL